MITVKGLKIGAGIPGIIVPVTEKTQELILEKTISACKSPCDAVELRLDAFEELRDHTALSELIAQVKRIVGEKILLLTIRTAYEGGLVSVDKTEYESLLEQIISSGQADMLDMEEALVSDQVISSARSRGIAVVLSCHHFEGTPSVGNMLGILERMEERGASIAKLAVMANSFEDTDRLMAAARKAQQIISVPRILIAMGEKGLVSRLAGESYGIAMTFASGGRASAPGQIDVWETASILRGIHKIRQSERLLYLIGFMGSGKSAVSRRLGQITGQIVYEMDDMIEKAAGCSIPKIFEIEGEEGFRRRETDLLAHLANEKGGIVSCGGGLVTRPENVSLMRRSGDIMMLMASADSIMERLSGGIAKRPLLQGDDPKGKILALMEKRQDCYAAAADMMLPTDGKTPERVALDAILMVEKAMEVE